MSGPVLQTTALERKSSIHEFGFYFLFLQIDRRHPAAGGFREKRDSPHSGHSSSLSRSKFPKLKVFQRKQEATSRLHFTTIFRVHGQRGREFDL